jgi:hypothetical protein
MRKTLTVVTLLAATLAISACSGRFVGTTVCSKDGSPVWFEYPNSQGSYEGLDNSPANCAKK